MMNEWLDFSDFVDKTHELIDLGLYDEAAKLLEDYTEVFTGEWEFYFIYSRLFTEQDRPKEAIPCLHKGLRLDPVNIDCLIGLFYAHTMLHNLDKAGVYLLRAEKYYPDNEIVLSALIWFHTEKNQLPLALTYFDRCKACGSTNPETFRNAGIAFDRSGMVDNAVECYTIALGLHPHYDEVRELLSDLYIATGKVEKAVELYQNALTLSPNNIRYSSKLIFCLSQNNQPEKAIALAEESIQRYPNSPIGYVDLAYLYLNIGELDKAVEAAEKASNISPLDAESFRVQAIVYSEKEMDDHAEKAFEAALERDPENPEILRDYYHHFRQTGNFVKMEETVFRVIDLEKPACIEEYWFLADYYRESQEDLKSLHFLNLAFKIRPAEYDLLPCIVDILLENGHQTFALRFLRHYVECAGWDRVMDQFALYPELAEKRTLEGLRFLMFCGSTPIDFHRYLFKRSLVRFAFASFFLVAAAAAFPAFALFGSGGIVATLACTAAIVTVFGIIRFVRVRKMQATLSIER